MVWVAILLLAAGEGCSAQFRSLDLNTWGNGGNTANPYGAQIGQYGHLYGASKWPWWALGGLGFGPCSLQLPLPCQYLPTLPQPSSPIEAKTGLNSMDADPPAITTTSPPPPLEKPQPSMSEYVPPQPQPPCALPVQGCTCTPGVLTLACLQTCMTHELFGGQAVPQYSAVPAGGYGGALPQYGGQTGNQPTMFPSNALYQATSQQSVYGGQLGYPGQSLNQPAPFPKQILNQPFGHPGLFTGQNPNHQWLYGRDQPTYGSQAQPYGTQNQPFGGQNQNYGSQAQEEGSHPVPTFTDIVRETKRSLEPTLQDRRKHVFNKKL